MWLLNGRKTRERRPMELLNSKYVIKFHIKFRLRTPLLLRTGEGNEIYDNTIDKTPDGKRLHINGYVWANLLRRGLKRIKGGESWAEMIGKYKAEENGVSPLWCEESFVELPRFDGRPGIMIDRKWGAATTSALYTEEIVPPGITLPLHFNWFLEDADKKKELIEKISQALWAIDEGIENIGGGWSYGFGRLRFESGRYRLLDLSKEDDRELLFKPLEEGSDIKLSPAEKAMPWEKLRVKFKIVDGQLLAIHTKTPLLEEEFLGDELPDAFVFKGYKLEGDKLVPKLVVPGKAIRQAVFSKEIERRLRTKDKEEKICDIRDAMEAGKKTPCSCKRCKWFGSTSNSGILAVLDATIEPISQKVESIILHRIQLCEHSAQNMQLFAGEYISGGSFETEIIIDQARSDSGYGELKAYIEEILEELKLNGGPPGWYRIGATSTCTGQIEVVDYEGD